MSFIDEKVRMGWHRNDDCVWCLKIFHPSFTHMLRKVISQRFLSTSPAGLGHVFIVTELACGGDLLALLLSEGEVRCYPYTGLSVGGV